MKTIKTLLVMNILLIFFCVSNLFSQSTTFTTLEFPGYKGDFNFDNNMDVVFYETSNTFTMELVPSRIAWGSSTITMVDSMECTSSTFSTYIEYPEWENLKVTLSITNFNVNDSIPDLTFFLSGKLLDIDSTLKDTTRNIVIFGQEDISTLDTIKLNDIDSIQTNPFIACDLSIGRGLSDPDYRSVNGTISYIYTPIYWGPSQAKKEIAEVEENNSDFVQIRDPIIYPNPADNYLYINLDEKVKCSDFSYQIININGEIISSKTEWNESKNQIKIDLSNIHSGFYYLVVNCNNIIKYSFPLVIHK